MIFNALEISTTFISTKTSTKPTKEGKHLINSEARRLWGPGSKFWAGSEGNESEAEARALVLEAVLRVSVNMPRVLRHGVPCHGWGLRRVLRYGMNGNLIHRSVMFKSVVSIQLG